ncbi:MAG: endonuclease III domain-containing protein [Candidatus Omnitrophota bacterium]
MKQRIRLIYKKAFLFFGAQNWWPARTKFEVMVGAILTQNTNWKNVEKVIDNLKKKKLLEPGRLVKLNTEKLAQLIRSSGYYNIKARRLKSFLDFFHADYQGSIKKMKQQSLLYLREKLLSVNGIGPESADSILLYALDKPIFVVDAYTKRILQRHRLIKADAEYLKVQGLFMRHLKHNVQLFNEYHALLVRLGKEYCLKNKPKCEICPLKNDLPKNKKS